MIDFDKVFSIAPSWTSLEERQLLSYLAQRVKDNGQIVEIGCLYGGMTAILALSNSKARITSIDNFSWTPPGYPEVSPELTKSNLSKIGANNVSIIVADSLKAYREWQKHIDLLWIDGGHSYQYIYSDLTNFGKYADVIALHDYKNPHWPTIEKAVNDFLSNNKALSFYLSSVVGSVAVLERRQHGP